MKVWTESGAQCGQKRSCRRRRPTSQVCVGTYGPERHTNSWHLYSEEPTNAQEERTTIPAGGADLHSSIIKGKLKQSSAWFILFSSFFPDVIVKIPFACLSCVSPLIALICRTANQSGLSRWLGPPQCQHAESADELPTGVQLVPTGHAAKAQPQTNETLNSTAVDLEHLRFLCVIKIKMLDEQSRPHVAIPTLKQAYMSH